MSEEIVNRVAKSSLMQIDLDDYLPKGVIEEYDMAQNLFQGIILKEKDFREFVANHSWEQYAGKNIALFCSVDAIIPNWAFMILASKFKESGGNCFFGTSAQVEESLLLENFKKENLTPYKGGKILIKGCGSIDLSPATYVEITNILQPFVKSLMFGEACSTVPVYKS